MWSVADPMRANWVSEVSELNMLCWLTSFHLLCHMDTGFWPDRAGSWCTRVEEVEVNF